MYSNTTDNDNLTGTPEILTSLYERTLTLSQHNRLHSKPQVVCLPPAKLAFHHTVMPKTPLLPKQFVTMHQLSAETVPATKF